MSQKKTFNRINCKIITLSARLATIIGKFRHKSRWTGFGLFLLFQATMCGSSIAIASQCQSVVARAEPTWPGKEHAERNVQIRGKKNCQLENPSLPAGAGVVGEAWGPRLSRLSHLWVPAWWHNVFSSIRAFVTMRSYFLRAIGGNCRYLAMENRL